MKDIIFDKYILQIDDLAVKFGQREVLSGVSLKVKAGEVAVLIGTNGSGKSTLLQTIVGISRSWAGKILLDGRNIISCETQEIVRAGIGYLMQSNSVFPNLTVAEHLQLASETLGGKNNIDSNTLIQKNFPSPENYQNKRAGVLSGGERQMLAFAMLLIQDAKIWLLDEPSAGLAPQAASHLLGLVRKLSVELEIAVLLVEQNVSEALRIADKIYLLESGRIRQVSRPEIKSAFLGESVLNA
jgi:branched-chain amino acid transport system ATP-binding protein